jgi:hypothetical protein
MVVMMIVRVIMGVRPVVVPVVVMGVAVIILVMDLIVRAMAGSGVGAPLGIERRLDLDDAGAETPDHFLDDVVAPDPKPPGYDLGRQMAVAEMPGDAHQMVRIGAAYLDQRLRRGDHFDQAAIFQNQRVAAAQRHRRFQVEQEFEPARAGHRHPAPVAVVEIKYHGVGGCLCPAVLALNFCSPDHADLLTASRPCHR